VIESALVIPMKMTHYLVNPMIGMSYGLIKQKWFAKLQFKELHIKNELYDDYYRDTCMISKQNMISFLKANSWYEVDKKISNTQAKVFITVGEKEQNIMIRSARKLNAMIPGSSLEIQKNLYHGEFSINYARKYAKKLECLIKA